MFLKRRHFSARLITVTFFVIALYSAIIALIVVYNWDLVRSLLSEDDENRYIKHPTRRTGACKFGPTTVFAAYKIHKNLNNTKFFDGYRVKENHLHKMYYVAQGLVDASTGGTEPTMSIHQFMKHYFSNKPVTEDMYTSVGMYLKKMRYASIQKSRIAKKGTQLKLMLDLADGTRVIFKPKWYNISEVIEGPVYAGKDRHYAEYVAFVLSLLMNFRKTALAVRREVNLVSEIIPTADTDLLKTFSRRGDDLCFYGRCLYCTPNDPICGEGDVLEGVVTYYLSDTYNLIKMRHPWQRTYNCSRFSRWEMHQNYCLIVQQSTFYNKPENKQLLLDLIDVSIFDFILGNGDRHHYEFIYDARPRIVLFLDNGKSFGNPLVDHIDILAPLYQCCKLRHSTWDRVVELYQRDIVSWFRGPFMESDLTYTPLTENHYDALRRRIKLVVSAVTVCFEEQGGSRNVLIDEFST